MNNKKNLSSVSGQISPNIVIIGGLIIGAIVMLVVIGGIFWNPGPQVTPTPIPTPPPVTREATVGNVKFKLVEVKDLGNRLKVSESNEPKSFQSDLVTTERFLKVTVSAENLRKDNIPLGGWDITEVYDKDDRKFYTPMDTRIWIPNDSKCGEVLKPSFTATLCTKIYEVAKTSTDLKIQVSVRDAGAGFVSLDM